MNQLSLTGSDRRILSELQSDATLSLRDLAERCHLSPSTAWRRVQEMEAAGIITDRVTLADPDALGLTVCSLVNVDIAPQTAAARRAFEDFVLVSPNILQCHAVTGSSDYILTTRHRSVAEFERFLMDDLLAHPSVSSSRSQLVLRQVKNATALPL